MPYFTDAQVYLEQSILLLQARPTTTRISTHYHLAPPTAGKPAKADATADAAAPPKPRGSLTLKTFDPVSGACLKYKTNKAAEIGRLIGVMQRCARVMAAVPLQDESTDIAMRDAVGPPAGEVEGQTEQHLAAGKGASGASGGGGKKKKRGKK